VKILYLHYLNKYACMSITVVWMHWVYLFILQEIEIKSHLAKRFTKKLERWIFKAKNSKSVIGILTCESHTHNMIHLVSSYATKVATHTSTRTHIEIA